MSTTPQYSQEVINIGTNANDGTGDPLRTAFDKVNNNFTNLFQTFTNSTIAYTTGNTPDQIIFETPANTFTQGQFWIQTSDANTNNSQTVQLYAQTRNDLANIMFTAYGTTIFGTALTSYDMTVDSGSGNVRILVNPLITDNLTHFISSSIMFAGPNVVGLGILGDSAGDLLSTESNLSLTTTQSQ